MTIAVSPPRQIILAAGTEVRLRALHADNEAVTRAAQRETYEEGGMEFGWDQRV